MVEIMPPISLALLGLLVKTPRLLEKTPEFSYSIVIPLHNKAGFVGDTIRSTFNQTVKAKEIIVIDDCSTDSSYQEASDVNGSFTLLQNEKNLGKARTVQKAITQHVTAPYVLVLDADTVLEPNYVEEAMRGFYKPEIQGVCGYVSNRQTETWIEKARIIEALLGQSYRKLQTRIIKGVWVLTGAFTIWRTDFLRCHPMPTHTLVEDMGATWSAQIVGEVNYNPAALGYAVQPSNFKDLYGQLNRWYSNRDVVVPQFSSVKKGLKFTVLTVYAEALWFLALGAITVTSWLAGNYLDSVIYLGLDALAVIAISYLNGRRTHVSLWTIIKSLPYYYPARLLNAFMFWKCLIKPKKKW